MGVQTPKPRRHWKLCVWCAECIDVWLCCLLENALHESKRLSAHVLVHIGHIRLWQLPMCTDACFL